MKQRKSYLYSLILTMFLTFNLISCGGGGGGTATPAGPLQVTTFSTGISEPLGIAFDSAGNIFATSTVNRLYSVSSTGVLTILIQGNPPFNISRDIVFDASDNAYIANDMDHTILKVETPYSAASVYAGQTGTAGNTNDTNPLNASFNRPYGLARYGNILYVADSTNSLIRKIDLATGEVTTFVTFGFPYDVAVDTNGNVYVCSSTSNTIKKFNPSGTETGSYALADNPVTPQIYSVAVTSTGNILAVDYANHIIWQITPAGDASVFAGTPGSPGLTNGNLLDAQFSSPRGIAIDPDGAIYIADGGNSEIRKISN